MTVSLVESVVEEEIYTCSPCKRKSVVVPREGPFAVRFTISDTFNVIAVHCSVEC